MPTIEIASIEATRLNLNQANFEVAIIEESKLESHRGLFYDVLIQQNGLIIHVGNPDLQNTTEGFYAGQIVDWTFEPGELFIPQSEESELTGNSGANQQFRFKFLAQYKADINWLLEIAVDNSPIRKACFLTDYQFGPEHASMEVIYTINDFWILHDNEGLKWNTMYEMYRR